jgi:hypothetical protein
MSGGDDDDIDTDIGSTESTTPQTTENPGTEPSATTQTSNVIQSKKSKLNDGTVYANINDNVIM